MFYWASLSITLLLRLGFLCFLLYRNVPFYIQWKSHNKQCISSTIHVHVRSIFINYFIKLPQRTIQFHLCMICMYGLLQYSLCREVHVISWALCHLEEPPIRHFPQFRKHILQFLQKMLSSTRFNSVYALKKLTICNF